MQWYYVNAGIQKGPVSEQDFEALVQQGVVNSQTLVWRDGMPSWAPYTGSASPSPVVAIAADYVTCAGCGRGFPRADVISLSGQPYCAACKPMALQRLKEGVVSSSAADLVRNEHIKHEASVKAIGFLYYLNGIGSFILCLSIVFGGRFGAANGFIFSAFLAVLALALFWVGTGLRKLKKWARIPTGIISGFGLLGFPVGTLINIYILYLIFSKKGGMVFSDEYKAIIEQTPHIKYRTSIVIWILLAVLVLLIGFAFVGVMFGRR